MDSQKMDSQKRDDFRERRREEAIARRVGEALDRLSLGEAGGCPDADILAAYHERSLADGEIAQWENHFAGCGRCRKILAVLAASLDAPLAEDEVARLGKLVAVAERSPKASPSQKLTPIRPLLWDWRSRWLAPVLGVAAVLALWFAVRPPWRASGPESSEMLVAQLPKNEIVPSAAPQELDRLSKVAHGQDLKTEQKTEPASPHNRSFASTNALSLQSDKEAHARQELDSEAVTVKASPKADAGASALQENKKLGSSLNESPVPPLPPAPPQYSASAQAQSEAGAVAPVPKPQVATGAATAGTSTSSEREEPAPQRPAGAMVVTGPAPRAAMGPTNGRSLNALKETLGAPVLMKSPSGSTTWRGGKGGGIERSTDEGLTYIAQISPTHEDWLAAAAISDTIAWLVGRNGAIARTTDGEHWEAVAPPLQVADSAGRLPDWISISAGNAQSATIAARDGRRFATQDGGKTWQAQ